MDTTEEVNDKQQGIETIYEQFEGITNCLSNFKTIKSLPPLPKDFVKPATTKPPFGGWIKHKKETP